MPAARSMMMRAVWSRDARARRRARPLRDDLRTTLVQALGGFFAHKCAQMGAAIAFWGLFSIFPLVLSLVAVAGLFVDRTRVEEAIIDWVIGNVSVTPEGQEDIEQLLTGAVSGLGAIGLFGLIGLVWAASALMSAIRNGVDAAWDAHARRHYVRGKLLDLALVAGFGVLFAASLTMTITLRLLTDGGVVGEALSGVGWELGRVLIPVLLSFVTFSLVFRILPPVRTHLRDVWIGALVSAVLFEMAKVGLSLYFSSFSDYSEVYGSLGAVISFLFFVYVGACILLIGAELAAAWPRVRAGAYDADPDETLRGWLHGQFAAITADKPADPLAMPTPRGVKHAAPSRPDGEHEPSGGGGEPAEEDPSGGGAR